MCLIFSGQDPVDFLPVKRSLRIKGHSTSLRLEKYYWAMLDRIAEKQGMDTPKFLNTIYEEIMELQGEAFEEGRNLDNFASLLRVGCVKFSQNTVQVDHDEISFIKDRLKGIISNN